MIVTTYTCDCCGKQDTNPNDMRYIAINYNPSNYGAGSRFHEKLWCSACCNKFQLKWIDPVKPPDPLVTLEDVVREIIREEINASH